MPHCTGLPSLLEYRRVLSLLFQGKGSRLARRLRDYRTGSLRSPPKGEEDQQRDHDPPEEDEQVSGDGRTAKEHGVPRPVNGRTYGVIGSEHSVGPRCEVPGLCWRRAAGYAEEEDHEQTHRDRGQADQSTEAEARRHGGGREERPPPPNGPKLAAVVAEQGDRYRSDRKGQYPAVRSDQECVAPRVGH